LGRDSRRNGRRILTPAQAQTDQSVPFDQISKRQLAVALNEQTERFRQMREQLRQATRVLCAIALEPESFRFADGTRTIDAAALAKVTQGMQLHLVETVEGHMTLNVSEPAIQSPLVIPKVAISS